MISEKLIEKELSAQLDKLKGPGTAKALLAGMLEEKISRKRGIFSAMNFASYEARMHQKGSPTCETIPALTNAIREAKGLPTPKDGRRAPEFKSGSSILELAPECDIANGGIRAFLPALVRFYIGELSSAEERTEFTTRYRAYFTARQLSADTPESNREVMVAVWNLGVSRAILASEIPSAIDVKIFERKFPNQAATVSNCIKRSRHA